MEDFKPNLVWSENEPPLQIVSADHLDELIDWLIANKLRGFPISASVNIHGCQVDILLGTDESFVHINDLNSHREAITVGDSKAEGYFDFWLHVQHHTQFERRWLIPLSLARDVLREFFVTGERSSKVEWEHFEY